MSSPSVPKDFNLNLLSALGAVCEADIEELRKKLKPEVQEAFDEKPQHLQIVLTALSKSAPDELSLLATTEKRLVGVHDVRDEARFLLEGIESAEKEGEGE